MRDQVNWKCPDHVDPYECPDALIAYSVRFDEYGLIIHDGGSSQISIQYCPWCGARLPESKGHRWFEELEKLGILEPDDERIPPEFKTDEWYRRVDVPNEDTARMRDAGTLTFLDHETSEEAVAIVRHNQSHMVLTLSLKSNGDVMATMTKWDARRLIRMFRDGISETGSNSPASRR
jgi:hypothetical protein